MFSSIIRMTNHFFMLGKLQRILKIKHFHAGSKCECHAFVSLNSTKFSNFQYYFVGNKITKRILNFESWRVWDAEILTETYTSISDNSLMKKCLDTKWHKVSLVSKDNWQINLSKKFSLKSCQNPCNAHTIYQMTQKFYVLPGVVWLQLKHLFFNHLKLYEFIKYINNCVIPDTSSRSF